MLHTVAFYQGLHCLLGLKHSSGTEVHFIWFWFLICYLHPSQQFFSHIGTSLSGLNQYLAKDKVSCSRTHRNFPPVRLKPETPQFQVKYSTSKPPHSSFISYLAILTYDPLLCTMNNFRLIELNQMEELNSIQRVNAVAIAFINCRH